MAKSRSKKTYPVLLAHWNTRIDRWRSRGPKHVFWNIAPGVEWEARLLLVAYHGGTRQAAWALFKFWISVEVWQHYTSCARLLISDWMGWTKLHHYPEDDKYHARTERHGRYCEGYPYSEHPDVDCISQGVPRWFRWLTRWDKI